jgi:hypothetical protein
LVVLSNVVICAEICGVINMHASKSVNCNIFITDILFLKIQIESLKT